MLAEYDKIARNYGSLTESDPVKNFVQYPAVLKLVGNVSGKRILDIGCGNGILSRAMAEKGAAVVAFDMAKKQIALAKSFRTKNVVYLVSDQQFRDTKPFDLAICIMVLNYAPNEEKLRKFFECAHENLKKGRPLLSVVVIPNKRDFGKIIFNRRSTKLHGRKVKVEFFNVASRDRFAACIFNFSRKEYETAAKQAGFKKFKWIDLRPTPEGSKAMGKAFWKEYLRSRPYKIFVVKK
jgi:cyclopropane fatty-acyl-phospholipid synthase-like methyltransferase